MKSNKIIYSFLLIPVFLSCYFSKNEKEKNEETGKRTIVLETKEDGDKYQLNEAFKNLSFESPVELVAPDDGTDRIFVVEQKGVIKTFPNTASAKDASVFLD